MTQVSPLWQPSAERISDSNLEKFRKWVNNRLGRSYRDYWDLHQWSVSDKENFWGLLADYLHVKWQEQPQGVLQKGKTMREDQWFPKGLLNFAENQLPPPSDQPALISVREGEEKDDVITARQLRNRVAQCQAALRKHGVGKGDRVAGMVANTPEAIIAMLATTSLGAIWSSCSPDFGVNGIVDRFGQIEPKVAFFTTSYRYNGKTFDCAPTVRGCLEQLKTISKAVAIPVAKLNETELEDFTSFLASSKLEPKLGEDLPLTFEPVSFQHPVYIMFSSGTTGVPKCIVHGVGGTLLQHKKELALHSDIHPGDRLLYFTTCGWMMWNWMVSALSVGAAVVLFEGSVAYPDFSVLWSAVARHGVTHFGTSPKFVAACMKANFHPRKELDLSQLRAVLSTGSPLLPEHFAWIYEEVGKDIHLASISGGTDIISCFMLGVPTLPVYAGEIQGPGLGMAVESWDDDAKPVRGEKGELVCTQSFVSMPVGFWNDPKGEKFKKAYFDFYQDQDVWRHGDYIEVTPRGGIVVFGRSDATLNPGGVRIGTAEIYRQVESLEGVMDSLAIGYENHGDVDIWLFVKLADNASLDEALIQKIRQKIRTELTPRHVPAKVIQVKDIPYTRSGKKVELAVKQAVHGEKVENVGALANPEALTEYFALSGKGSARHGI